jgi:Cu+-exporting ATPase
MHEPDSAIHAVTSVLLVACPCALALAGPFVLGTAARIWGENGFFLRNTNVVESLSHIDEIVFDKTGTLTVANSLTVEQQQRAHFESQRELIASLARLSTHPLSRAITRSLNVASYLPVYDFQEVPGSGIRGIVNGKEVKIGNATWCSWIEESAKYEAADSSGVVHIAVEGRYIGSMKAEAKFRESIPGLLDRLKTNFSLSILSGDTKLSEPAVRSVIGTQIPIQFECSPHAKQQHIQTIAAAGKRIVMLGDGLNDAGAINAASVGISVTEDISSFTPACDGILDAKKLGLFDRFLQMAKRSQNVIIAAYCLSLAYNVVGLAFAVTGHLSPFVSAILMPVSSITVVLFATAMTRRVARQEGLR